MEKLNKGQSLIELLIAVALAVVIIMGAMRLLQFLIKVNTYDPVAQAGALLAHDGIQSVVSTAQGSWTAIASTTAGAHYHLATSTSGFAVASGDESKTVNAITYIRYFTVNPVSRDGTDGIVASGGVDDSSSKKIAVNVSWSYQGKSYSTMFEHYVTRTRNEVLSQTDWVGGPSCVGDPIVIGGSTNNRFCNVLSGAVDYQSQPGTIKIQGY